MNPILNSWAHIQPTSAYEAGLLNNRAKFFIPTEKNIAQAEEMLDKIIPENKIDKKLINTLRWGLVHHEPQEAPALIASAFFSHLARDGFNEKFLIQLTDNALKFLEATAKIIKDNVKKSNDPITFELRCLTSLQVQGVYEVLQSIERSKNLQLKQSCKRLQTKLQEYDQSFGTNSGSGTFADVYTLLEKHAVGIDRPWYKSRLKQVYDFSESPKEIAYCAKQWLKKELPIYNAAKDTVARIHKVASSIESIDKSLTNKYPIVKGLKTVDSMRKTLQGHIRKDIVRIAPAYDVRLMATPLYLARLLPTAAMMTFDTMVKPYQIYFLTESKALAPSSSCVELLNTTVHEDYGHCVNFSNSSAWLNNTRKHELVLDFSTPITEGISFQREHEFLNLVNTNSQVRQVIAPWSSEEDLRFVTYQWRIIRFLRALGDVWVNTGKYTIPEFISWAHENTSISKKTIYDNFFHFLESPGHASSYAVVGQKIKTLQQKILKKDQSIVEFNTYAASMGFPGQQEFFRRLSRFSRTGYNTVP